MSRDAREARRTTRPPGSWGTRLQKKRSRGTGFSAEDETHRERHERIRNTEEGGDSTHAFASQYGRRPGAEEEDLKGESKEEQKKEGGGEQREGEEAMPVSESRWQEPANAAETKSTGRGRRMQNLGSGGDSRTERGDLESLQDPEKETDRRGDSKTRLRGTTRGSAEQQAPREQAGRSRRQSPEEGESETRKGKRRKTLSGEPENRESVGGEALLQTCEEIPRVSSPSSFSPGSSSLCVSSPSLAVFKSAARDALRESEKRRRPPSRLLLLPSTFASPADLSSLPLETDEAAERSSSSRRRGLAKKSLSSSLSKAEGDKEAGCHDPSSVKDPKRFSLFHRFDQGIQLDEDMWWSVSYEDMALQMASCCSCPLLWDAFGGVGGNATHFARGFCGFVVCSELSPERVRMAKHNVSVYGRQVASRVDFVLGDFRHLSSRIFRQGTFDGIFLAPPWGGPAYQASPVFNLRRLGAELDAFDIVRNAARLAPSAALYLPRNTRLGDIQEFAEVFDTSHKGDRESDAGRTDACTRDEGQRLENDNPKEKTGAPVSRALSFAPPGPPAEPCSPTTAATHNEERKAEEGEEGDKKTRSVRASQEETREGQPCASCSSAPQTHEDESGRSLNSAGASPGPALAVVLLHANRLQFGQKAPKLKLEKGELRSKATLATAEQRGRDAGRRLVHPGKEDASAYSSECEETTSEEAGKATAGSELRARGGETEEATCDRVPNLSRIPGEVEKKVKVGGEQREADAFESVSSPVSPSSLRPRVTSSFSRVASGFDENAFLGISACGIVACPRCARGALGRRTSQVTAEKEVREESEQTEKIQDFQREAEELDCSARTADMVDASWEPWRAVCPFQYEDSRREDSTSASLGSPVDVPRVRSASLPSSSPSWRWKLVGITVYLGDFARRLYNEVASSPSSLPVSFSPSLSSSRAPSGVSSPSARSSEVCSFSPVAGPHHSPCGSSAFPPSSVAWPLSLSQSPDATTRVLAVLQSLGRASLHLLGLMSPRSLPRFGVSASLPRYFSPRLSSGRSASGGVGREATGPPSAVGDRTAGENQDEGNAEEYQKKTRERRNAFLSRSPGDVDSLGEGQQQGTHDRHEYPTVPLVLSPFGVPLSLLPPDDLERDEAPERPGSSRTGDAAEDHSAAVCVSSSLRGRRFVSVGRAKPGSLGGGCRTASQSRDAEVDGSHVQKQGRKRRRSETANAIDSHTLPSLSSERGQLHSWVYGGFVPGWTERASEGELDRSLAEPKVGKEASSHPPACRSSGEATEEHEVQRRAVQRPEDGEGEKGETEVGKAAETRDRDRETSELLWKASQLLLSLEVRAKQRKQGEEVLEGKDSTEDVPKGVTGGDEKGIESATAERIRSFLLPTKQLSCIFLHLFLAAVVERTVDVRGVDPRQNVIWSRYADQSEREHGESSARGKRTNESGKPEEAERKRARRAEKNCPSSEREAKEDTEEKEEVEEARRDRQRRRCDVVDGGDDSRTTDSNGVGKPSNKGEARRHAAEEREGGARVEGRQTRSGQSVSAESDTDLHESSGTALLVNSLFRGTAKAAIERAFPRFCDFLMYGDAECGRTRSEDADAKQSETLVKNEEERRPSAHVAREIACSLMNNSSFQWILNLHVERLVSILAACK